LHGQVALKFYETVTGMVFANVGTI